MTISKEQSSKNHKLKLSPHFTKHLWPLQRQFENNLKITFKIEKDVYLQHGAGVGQGWFGTPQFL